MELVEQRQRRQQLQRHEVIVSKSACRTLSKAKFLQNPPPNSQNPDNDDEEWTGFESHATTATASQGEFGGYQSATASSEQRNHNTSGSGSNRSSARSSLKMKQSAAAAGGSLDSDFSSLDIKAKPASTAAAAAKKSNNAEDDLWNMLNN